VSELAKQSLKNLNSISGIVYCKLKGNKIFVHIGASRLPKSALRYIIAHEIAHSLAKKHTKRFWKIVETIYPRYQLGQSLLIKYGSELGN
jgi:predicted metal-dependent hydrolase